MASLTPLTALGGITACDEMIGGIRIAEIADTCLASLAMRRGKAANFKKAAKKALGTDLPAPGQRTGNGTHGVIWMGPDQFLVEVETGMTDIAGTLGTAFGTAASITDQSDSWARFDITGKDVPAMLERLCAADTRLMQGGAAVRTPIHHMLCVVVCRDAYTSFTIYGPRASARSLHHALAAAAASL
ncbi:MAG: sarcosine oxidase subunit gamma [Pseudomonadota bacterium]|nr:sarcosine oxidase subunit gamma [Pseudomonadota bacterium]